MVEVATIIALLTPMARFTATPQACIMGIASAPPPSPTSPERKPTIAESGVSRYAVGSGSG